MPYKRRRLSRFRYRRRRFRGGIRRRGLRRIIKRTVARMQEIKYGIVNSVGASDTTAFGVHYLTPNIGTGTTRYSRVGNRIRYKRITVTFSINFYPSTIAPLAGATYWLRVTVVRQRKVFLSPPTAIDVFMTSDPQSSIDPHAAEVLYDKYWSVAPVQTLYTGLPCRITRRISFRNPRSVQFESATNQEPIDNTDRYWMFIRTSNEAGTVNQTNYYVDLYMKQSFYDM